MVGVSLRHGGEELLDRQAGLGAYVERGAVMGIPFLHPWANRLAGFAYSVDGRDVRLPPGPPLVHCDEHGLPIHGVLAASRSLGGDRAGRRTGGTARVRAALDFAAHPELMAAFPFPHEVQLEAALTAGGLTITTRIRATGDVPVPVSFGFHPYLRLPGADRARLAGRRCRRGGTCCSTTRGIPTGETEERPATAFELGDRHFDDGYDRLPDGAVLLGVRRRTDAHGHVRARLPGRADLRPRRIVVHLLRADDGADQRAPQRRRAAARRPRPGLRRGLLDRGATRVHPEGVMTGRSAGRTIGA